MIENPDAGQPGALTGLRVLDLAGPMGVYCGKLLADLGADVIRVEPPQGDASRRLTPFYEDEPGLERSLFHWHYNANKRGVTLDITTRDGQALFKRLASSAGIVIETFRPGYLDGLGLGFEALKVANPAIVLVSITPFGQTGPYRDYQGEELIGQASGGLLWMCGWPDRPPVMMGGNPAMHQASAQAAAAALIALELAEASGEGQHVDVSVQAAMPMTLMASMFDYHATGVVRRPRIGDRYVTLMNGLFACSDGYVDIRFRGRPEHWERLVAWMDSAGMAEDLGDEQWSHHAFRSSPENFPHVHEVFARFVATLTKEEAMDQGQRAGLVAGAVHTAKDLLKDPQLQARQFFVEVEHEEIGRSFVDLGGPYRLSGTPWQLSRRAPLLGEHNVEVYKTELGVSQDQIETLRAAEII